MVVALVGVGCIRSSGTGRALELHLTDFVPLVLAVLVFWTFRFWRFRRAS